ncbi:putative dolichyl pyrophosphate Glc1Man9GlcNAc2 alpha-13-glucosyltransferase [Dissostichus eleginoides]|uniref:Alpha-1,3-glucosyltransferase n=1 Tax=Dissostichus eleginoides TaxID=100907 RepID=A0AAD9B0H8_DISEL|nr:putative dolichyl pyrophosphate Glc1Man9GlcNAc2 alpha-13-glucosyltransferase [Dissostichus eleginoides]
MAAADSSWFPALSLGVSLFKCLFISAYHSTDFEVHRNWLAITHSLPLDRWYHENSSEWTLDYPPLFAWFELALSQGARLLHPPMLLLSNLNYSSPEAVLYQRLTEQKGSRDVLNQPSFVLAVLLLWNFGLLIVDHIHFQYNGFLFGVLLLSMAKHMQGALLFAVLLNLKHIFLYVAQRQLRYLNAPLITLLHQDNSGQLGYLNTPLIILLHPVQLRYLNTIITLLHPGQLRTTRVPEHTINLLLHPVQLRYLNTPLVHTASPRTAQTVLFDGGVSVFSAWRRWAASCCPSASCPSDPSSSWVSSLRCCPGSSPLRGASATLLGPERLGPLQRTGQDPDPAGVRLQLLQEAELPKASMTGGLVQEFQHTVLPSVTPPVTLLCTVLSILSFLRCLLLCSLGSFLFGWHVHEKAVLLAILPLSLLAVQNREDAGIFLLLSTTGHYSLFPLLFTCAELPIKVLLMLMFTLYSFSALRHLHRGPLLLPLETLYLGGLLPLSLCCDVLLPLSPWGARLPFLPLLATSLYCSLGIIYCFLRLYCSMLRGGAERPKQP